MKKILIGSKALKSVYPEFNREPKDTDYAVDGQQKNENKIEYLYNPIICNKYEDGDTINMDDLLTLKMSHIFWHENQFDKTMWDIQFLLRKGHKFNRSLFNELYEFWPEVLGKNKRSDLDMSADEFFDNAINPNMPIKHDDIHEILNPTPAYKQILVGEVKTCDQKFLNLTHQQKSAIVQEETMVMASERYRGQHYLNRYSKQLKKMILGHLTIEESIFAIINYPELNKAPYDFMSLINEELKNRNLELLK